MFRILLIVAAVLFGGALVLYFLPKKNYSSDTVTLSQGKNLFEKHCASCHSLSNDGIGPALGGVTEVLSKDHLLQFISNPADFVNANDKRALALNRRYKLMMPAFDWMQREEVISILAYINDETKRHQLKPVAINESPATNALSGRLLPPVKKSSLKIELEDVIQLPQLGNSTDLGIVTLRPYPAGEGTLFASDQNGVIYRIKNGRANVFINMREQIRDFQSGPGIATGIASFDFHPDFLNNGLIYIAYAETFKGKKADYAVSYDTLQSVVQWIVGEFKMINVHDSTFSGTHRELVRFHAPTFAHGFQDMSFIHGIKKGDPDYGLLYFGYGDGGSNNIHHPELCHNLHSFMGTIMRIDPSGHNSKNGKYGIPSDNPFVKENDTQTVKEIYAYGFRNPHRLSWDRTNDNRMMATDIGESNIEELNIIKKGGDYGWPRREGNFGINTVTDLKTVFKVSPKDNYYYQKPFATYDHEDGNAISGGFVYDGNIPALKNKYIFGDIVQGKIFYVNIGPQLSDSTVYEMSIVHHGKEATLKEMDNTKRLHLRIAYDQLQRELYIITKFDGKIRRVVNVY